MRTALWIAVLSLFAGASANGAMARGYSFESGCTNISREGSNITATCPDRSGGAVSTQIDAAGCDGDIVNSDGHLTCMGSSGRSRSTPAVSSGPRSCSVGKVGQCEGCAITCGDGESAMCKTGSTYGFADTPQCAYQAHCYCKH